jgi:hypothetical protein
VQQALLVQQALPVQVSLDLQAQQEQLVQQVQLARKAQQLQFLARTTHLENCRQRTPQEILVMDT